MIFTGYRQPPFFNLRGIYRIWTTSLYWFTRYLQDLDSPPFSIYMIFTGYRQPLFFNLHDIYRISTAPLFRFTWYLKEIDSPPFSIYMVFTGCESPLFSIYVVFTNIYRTSTAPPPFFNLRGIYRVSPAPFFNLQGIYNVIYRILAATLFQFTWYLQDLGRLPLINLHVIYMICVLLPYNIYSIFLYIYMFQCQNLHDIYSIFWEHVKVQKSCKFTFYSTFLPFYMLFT